MRLEFEDWLSLQKVSPTAEFLFLSNNMFQSICLQGSAVTNICRVSNSGKRENSISNLPNRNFSITMDGDKKKSYG